MATWTTTHHDDGYPLRIQHTQIGGRTCRRVVVGPEESAGAIALLVNTEGHILLVKQYRVSLDETLWELPRGMAEPGESILDTARRELAEETGYHVHGGTHLGETYPDSGILSSKVGIVVFTSDDIDQVGDTDGEVDDRAWFSPHDLHELITAGHLRDSMSLAALTIYATHIARSQI